MADLLKPMPSIRTLLDVCMEIIQYIQQMKDNLSERVRVMMGIFSISGILESLIATVRGAEAAPELWSETIRSINRKGGPLDVLQEVLIAVHNELGRVASAKSLKRIGESYFWPSKEKEVEEQVKVIDRQKLLPTLALDNDHAALSTQSDNYTINGDVTTISAGEDEASSDYCYTALSEKGSIRLLRLMPHEDEKAPIQCQVFEYPLQKKGQDTHLYEAISYVWGSEDNRQPICIQSDDKGNNHPTGKTRRFLVTENLYTALLHFRDSLVERILWIDAICINQGDNDEKGHQVQLMATIYAKANRVTVWLGEAPDENNQALEVIHKAAEEQSTSTTIDEVNEQEIITLLKRPWFQRIWVLQEVAAARHVLIKYGHAEMDGYVFCSGLDALNLSYKTSPDFQSLILPAVYLIRGAIFRSRYKRDDINVSSTFSLRIRPLAELVDMYHARKATNRLDKVYALLGMSSDDPSEAGLLVNYNTSWGEIFRKLVKFSLSDQVSVDTWDDEEVAIIEGKGYVLGEISSAGRDNTRDDRQCVDIVWKNGLSDFDPKRILSTRFTFQASAKPVQVGDVVCLLQGASKATIVRLCGECWTIIMIAAPFTDDLQKWLSSITTFPDDLLLVWDWHERRELQGAEDSKYLMNNREVPKCPRAECQCQDYLDKSVKLWNVGLLLNSIERYEDAGKNLRGAVEFYMTGAALRSVDKTYPDHGPWRKTDEEVLGVLDLLSTTIRAKHPKEGQMPLWWAAEEGHEVVLRQLLNKDANVDAKDKLVKRRCYGPSGMDMRLLCSYYLQQVMLMLTLTMPLAGHCCHMPLRMGIKLWCGNCSTEAPISITLAGRRCNKGASMLLWAAQNGHRATKSPPLRQRTIMARRRCLGPPETATRPL
ncbi:heterokaryon incompatibility protein-domain-containing protein [Xylaria sp. FL1777]|nr:heterokaryon incompatibility protein-domain-containing protein [Xylaria sp. FL1777]